MTHCSCRCLAGLWPHCCEQPAGTMVAAAAAGTAGGGSALRMGTVWLLKCLVETLVAPQESWFPNPSSDHTTGLNFIFRISIALALS